MMKVLLILLFGFDFIITQFLSNVFSQVSDEDKIINNKVINMTYPDPNVLDPPDYSIFLQIDIKKNSSAYNSDFVIVDNTGFRLPEKALFDLPIDKDFIRKIRTVDAKKLFEFLETI